MKPKYDCGKVKSPEPRIFVVYCGERKVAKYPGDYEECCKSFLDKTQAEKYIEELIEVGEDEDYITVITGFENDFKVKRTVEIK